MVICSTNYSTLPYDYSDNEYCTSCTPPTADGTDTAQNGTVTVEETIQSMQTIKDKTNQTSEIITSMGKQSEEITDILATINDIASQTNLLALTAAIEEGAVQVNEMECLATFGELFPM